MNKILPNSAKARAITFALFCFLVSFIGKAQTTLVTWPLSSTSTTAATGVDANVTAVAETYSTWLAINSYTGFSTSQRLNIPTTYTGQTAVGWPALQTTEISDVWIEFAVSPNSGLNLNVNAITMSLCGASTGNMKANVYISTDHSFATRTQIYDGSSTLLPNGGAFTTVNATSLGYTVINGKTLYIRVYPWYNNQTTASAGRYICLQNIILNGTTSVYVPPPSAPNATAATNIASVSFTANWDAAATATGYQIDVATDNSFSNLVITNADVPTGTSYSAAGLSASTPYFYRVRAYSASGTSGNSNTITLTTAPPVTPPSAPTATAATATTTTSFSANWTTAATATGYRLDVSTSPTFATFVAGFNNFDAGNVLTTPVTGLTAGTTYYFQVRAYNTGGPSLNSNTINLSTIPAAPVATAATNLAQVSFSANWAAATTATGYKLDVSTSPTFATYVTGFSNLDVGNVTAYPVTGLTAGTVYYYQVRANNASGISANSNAITITTIPLAPATAPTGLTATQIKATTIALSWNAVTSTFPIDYYLDVATDAAFTSFAPITSTTSYNNVNVFGVTTYTVTALVAQTTYYIRVRANNTGGNGPYSTVLKISTILETPLPPATAAASASTTTGFTANWVASASATGYYLDVATESPLVNFVSGFHNLDVSSVVTYPVTGLTPNTTYYYQVRAYNSIGTSASNAVITATTLKNNDATLKTLLIGGISYPSFSAATTSYNIGYPYPISTPPTINVVTTDPNASVTVTQASATPWQATAAVVAQNGTTKSTYTINFTDATPVIDITGKHIQVVTSSNSIEIESANIISNVQVIGINGVKLFAKNFTSNSASISTQGWNTGIYIIKVASGSEMVTKKISLIK